MSVWGTLSLSDSEYNLPQEPFLHSSRIPAKASPLSHSMILEVSFEIEWLTLWPTKLVTNH